MRMQFPAGAGTWAAVAALAFATTGCATKKFVRQTVAPVEARTAALEKTTTEHGSSIGKLETDLSRTSERAMTADSKAQEAANAAAKAGEQAGQAQQQASQAQTLAQQGLDKANKVDQDLAAQKTTVENMDNYTLTSTESILFKLNSSELTKEGEAQLDSMIRKFDTAKHYAIQLEGFTDTTGPEQYNLQLSRRRAETVARYLALNGKIPLYRIHILGFGQENPAADNHTRQGREQNRRVEVGLLEAAVSAQTASTPGSMGGSQP